jgi:YebC/PmpR family DNA-binding regulatory protein
MPKDTIENIIKRASGQTGAKLEEVLYEGYGPGGVAIMVEALTDNRNRTSNEIRKLFERHGGSLGSVNCVVWQFDVKGFIVIDANNLSEEEVLNDAIEAGADNVDFTGDEFEITCSVANFSNLKEVMSSKYNVKSSEITKIPKTYINVDEAIGRKVLVLVEALQDHDDVQNVYSNFMLPPSLAEEMQKR